MTRNASAGTALITNPKDVPLTQNETSLNNTILVAFLCEEINTVYDLRVSEKIFFFVAKQ